jgi:signal transduction histidine kinase
MNPLDFLGRIKVKLGIVIVLAVGTAFVVNEVGINSGLSREVRIAVAVVLALIMVQVLAMGMTKPLRQMARAAQTIAKGNYNLRVAATSRDEVGELARAFNAMAADLGEVDRQRRELVANVSHELRTPITGLRAVLENVVDGVSAADPVTMRTALAQTERLGRLVAQLLDLSRLDSGVRLIEAEAVALAPLAEQAVREAALAREDVSIRPSVPDDLVLRADPDLLAQVLANLLDNAVRHSPPGGTVTVNAAASGPGVRLTVADQGPGIPASARARVFERFSRLDAGRAADAGGAGLGLAIVKEIVELHGGSVRIDDGPGCRMVVDLPNRITLPGTPLPASSAVRAPDPTTPPIGTASGPDGARAASGPSGGAEGTPRLSYGECAPSGAVGADGAAAQPGSAASGAPAVIGSPVATAGGSGAEGVGSPPYAAAPDSAAGLPDAPATDLAAHTRNADARTGGVDAPATGLGTWSSGSEDAASGTSAGAGGVDAHACDLNVRAGGPAAETGGEDSGAAGEDVRAGSAEAGGGGAAGALAAVAYAGGPSGLVRLIVGGLIGVVAGFPVGLFAAVPAAAVVSDAGAFLTLAGCVGACGAAGAALGVRSARRAAAAEYHRRQIAYQQGSAHHLVPASRLGEVAAGGAGVVGGAGAGSGAGAVGSAGQTAPAGGAGMGGGGYRGTAYVPPPLFPRPEVPEAPKWVLPAAAGAGAFAAVALPEAQAGLGLVLVAVVLGGAALPAVLRRVTPWTVAFGATAYWLVAMAAVRDADWLVAILLPAGAGLGALAVSGAGKGWMGVIRGGLSVLLALGPVPWFLAGPMKRLTARRRVLPTLAALGITAVLLLVFGVLFASADAVFATYVERLTAAPAWVEQVPVRIFLFGVFGVLPAAVVLVALRPVVDPAGPATRFEVSRSVWLVPLTAVNLLFAAFVAVQITALFGGDALVLETAGLTYAEYARQGFFQLVVVSVFVLGIVAVAAGLLKVGRRERWVLAALLGVLCGLTMVVLASALHRMNLYTDAYGLSRLRLSVQATVWWLGALFALVLVAGAVRLAGRGIGWLPRTIVLVTGLSLGAFALANPDLQVARTQVEIRGVTNLDSGYLGDLGAEAVPALDRLPEPQRSCVLRDVVRANGLAEPDPWNGWNLARAQARALLAERPLLPQTSCPARRL